MRIIITIVCIILFSTGAYAENGQVVLVNGYMCTSKLAVKKLHEYLMRPQIAFSASRMFQELKRKGHDCTAGRGILVRHENAGSFLRSDGRTVTYIEFWDPTTRKKLYSWKIEKGITF